MKFYISCKIEMIPSSTVLYMRRTGEYGRENKVLMESFKNWVRENGLYGEDSVIYAMAMDDPEKVESCKCRYDVCIFKPENREIELKEVEQRILEGGKYMTFLIPHTEEGIQNAWKMCFEEIEHTGYSLDGNRLVMERYKKRLVERHYSELCAPLL